MRQRFLTALGGLPILAAAVWFGAPWLTVLVIVAGGIALWEAYRLRPHGVGPLPVAFGVAWVTALLLGAQASSGLSNFLIISGGVLAGGAFVAALWFIAFYSGDRYPLALSYLLLGPVYVGFLLGHALALLEAGDGADLGRNWLIFALLATFATDTGAYFTGRAIGRHAMAPGISPNKTWEGAFGGFGSAIIAALLIGLAFDLDVPWWQQAVIGATVGAVSQWGDLFESKLKRVANAKDAGSIIPGHGGLLDRLDSILFALPAVYYLVTTVFES